MTIKGQNSITWEKENIFNTSVEDIILVVKETVIKNSRGFIRINKNDLTTVKDKFQIKERGA